MRRFLVDVVAAMPAVLIAGVIWYAVIEAPVLYACSRRRNLPKQEGPSV